MRPMNKGYMLMGVDIVHPMSMNPSVPSTGAMVATTDAHCMKYKGEIIGLGHREATTTQGGFAAAFARLVRHFVSKSR